MAQFSKWVEPGKRRHRRIKAGYQNVDWDAGNWTGGSIGSGFQAGTNMSISAPALSSWRGYPVTEVAMRALTESEALQIYRAKYWDKIKGDLIHSQLIADFAADMKSSAGGNGIKQLQKALNEMGAGISIDGSVGPQTLFAINEKTKENEAKLNNLFRDNMISFYQNLNSQGTSNWVSSLNRDYPPMNETAQKLGLPAELNNEWMIYVIGGTGVVVLILVAILFAKK